MIAADVFSPNTVNNVFSPAAFKGRVVLITGGGTGIGLEMARAFARCGATLVLASRNLDNCQAAAAELEGLGAKALALTVNIRDAESVDAMTKATVDKFGRLDVLFANAGANFLCPASNITPNGWRSVIDTVLSGTFYCAQAAGRVMMEQKHGRIIAMTATNGMNGSPLMAHSGAAKAGVINLMLTLASEWAQFGITANCISPGAVNTDGANKRLWADPEAMRKVAEQVPLGRMSVPNDILGTALFLASDAAAFITGANIVVDGGEYVRRFPSDFFG